MKLEYHIDAPMLNPKTFEDVKFNYLKHIISYLEKEESNTKNDNIRLTLDAIKAIGTPLLNEKLMEIIKYNEK